MLGPRTARYPMLSAYLNARPFERPTVPPGLERIGLVTLAAGTLAAGGTTFDASHVGGIALMAIGVAVGMFALRPRKVVPTTPERLLARRADEVVKQLEHQAKFNRLHRALHPAVGATLEECAGYWMRIINALDGAQWTGTETLPQWVSLREDALAATKIAMDEALVHAGSTLILVPPPKPLEHVSDALEDIGFGPLVRGARDHEPMPLSFRPVRALAERLRELAERCETAATQRRQESPEPVSAAFRRLDAALTEMRTLEEAEGELRQGA